MLLKPEASCAYAAGCISVMSTRVLDGTQLRRIADAPTEQEALNLLLETGYGGSNVPTNIEDIDYVIREQLQQTRKEIMTFTPDRRRTELFILEVDVHNLKVLLKSRLLGIEPPNILRGGGVFPVETLKECVKNKSYEALPLEFRKGLETLEVELTNEVDPLILSCRVDGAMFTYVDSVLTQRHDHGFVREYFSMTADFMNARALIRSQFLKWDEDRLRPQLVDGGYIDKKVFIEALDTPLEQLSGKLNRGPHGKLIAETIDDYNTNGKLPIFKKKMEGAQMSIVRKAAEDSFSLGPVIAYLQGRYAECKTLRVIFNTKRGGIDAEWPDLLKS